MGFFFLITNINENQCSTFQIIILFWLLYSHCTSQHSVSYCWVADVS